MAYALDNDKKVLWQLDPINGAVNPPVPGTIGSVPVWGSNNLTLVTVTPVDATGMRVWVSSVGMLGLAALTVQALGAGGMMVSKTINVQVNLPTQTPPPTATDFGITVVGPPVLR